MIFTMLHTKPSDTLESEPPTQPDFDVALSASNDSSAINQVQDSALVPGTPIQSQDASEYSYEDEPLGLAGWTEADQEAASEYSY